MLFKIVARIASTTFAALAAATVSPPVRAIGSLVNGDFELPDIPGNFSQLPQAQVPGWRTTATDGRIELWTSGFQGVPAFSGNQFAEINATEAARLFQDASGIPEGAAVGYQFAHRGRLGNDTLRLGIVDLGADNIFGNSDDTVLLSQTFTTGNSAWSFYQGSGIIAKGNTVRFGWEAVSSTCPNPNQASCPSFGNFLDAAAFGVGIPVPGPLSMLAPGVLLGTLLKARRRYQGLRKPI